MTNISKRDFGSEELQTLKQYANERLKVSYGLAFKMAQSGELPGALMLGGKEDEAGRIRHGRWMVHTGIADQWLRQKAINGLGKQLVVPMYDSPMTREEKQEWAKQFFAPSLIDGEEGQGDS